MPIKAVARIVKVQLIKLAIICNFLHRKNFSKKKEKEKKHDY